MSQLQLSPQGAAFLTSHEGFVPKFYRDPGGVGTIGTGFTWASEAFREWWAANKPGQAFGPGAKITREENAAALAIVFDKEYGSALLKFLAPAVPAQNVYDGGGSVVFNAGAGTLKDRWAAALKRGDLKAAADLLATTRITQKGVRLKGLVSRRMDEGELIELGDYTIGRPARDIPDAMADGMLIRGEVGTAVRQLQEALAALGLYDGVLDGKFGYGTEAAVMEFQRSRGLKADGFAGSKTLDALKGPPPVVAKVYGRDAIKNVQQKLRDLGYPEVGNVDGLIGSKFRAAVLAFRSDNGLPLVDSIDDELLQALMTAPHRAISVERATATAKDLKDAPGVQQGSKVTTIGTIATGAGAVGAIVSTVEKIQNGTADPGQIADGIRQVGVLTDAAMSLGPWALLAIGGAVAIYLGRGIIREQVTKYRSGNHV